MTKTKNAPQRVGMVRADTMRNGTSELYSIGDEPLSLKVDVEFLVILHQAGWNRGFTRPCRQFLEKTVGRAFLILRTVRHQTDINLKICL